MTRHVMKLYPWDEVLKSADALIRDGMDVYQQFNCSACGAKQTMDHPNNFHTTGICEECGHETNIVKHGHNYMVHAGNPKAVEAVLKRIAGEK